MMSSALSRVAETVAPSGDLVHYAAAEVAIRRTALGWSQNGLARRAGLDSGFLSNLLHNHISSRPGWRRVIRALERGERRLQRKPA